MSATVVAPQGDAAHEQAEGAGRTHLGLAAGLIATAAAIGWLAWPVVPALAVMLPLLWALAPSRWAAAGIGAGYALCTVRFLPDMAGRWFDSLPIGIALWLGIGCVGALVYGSLWRRSWTPIALAASTLALLLITMVVAVVLPGHMLVGWGFLLPGWGWFGVGAMLVLTPLGAVALAIWMPRRLAYWWAPLAAFVMIALVVASVGERPAQSPTAGRLAGTVGAINTQWGEFPEPGSMEVIQRIMKIGQAAQQLAGGDGGLATVVFPETVLGRYDPSLFPVIQMEIAHRIKASGQTVVVGADVMSGPGRYMNAAIIVRPDGSTSWLSARQTTPVGQWRPWHPLHMPADWLAPSVVDLGPGIKARLMFCHEEYMPLLHLLSEAREPHNLVVGLANLWAAGDALPNAVQSAHTEGMARLMGHRWVRAVNTSAPTATK